MDSQLFFVRTLGKGKVFAIIRTVSSNSLLTSRGEREREKEKTCDIEYSYVLLQLFNVRIFANSSVAERKSEKET